MLAKFNTVSLTLLSLTTSYAHGACSNLRIDGGMFLLFSSDRSSGSSSVCLCVRPSVRYFYEFYTQSSCFRCFSFKFSSKSLQALFKLSSSSLQALFSSSLFKLSFQVLFTTSSISLQALFTLSSSSLQALF